MAGATSGEERKSWEEAARWLGAVEADAREAERDAKAAAHLASQGKIREARDSIQKAIDLEAKYRQPSVWTLLHDAIMAACETTEWGA
jgi:hypothetical protein